MESESHWAAVPASIPSARGLPTTVAFGVAVRLGHMGPTRGGKSLMTQVTPSAHQEQQAVLVPRCLVCMGALLPHRRLPGLHVCAKCRFVTLAEQVDADQLRQLYGADYFHGEEYADYVSEGPELRANFRKRLEVLLALQSVEERVKLYEVGAAYGFFLDEARVHYDDVAGIDISSDAVAYAQEEFKLNIVAGDYLATDVGQVDCLTMWDTIEHLGEPRAFIEKAGRDVRAGGLLAVTTGDIESRNARMRGAKWRMIHPPTHLHYFSRETLAALLDSAGFDVVHVESAGNRRTLRAIAYALLVLKGGQDRLWGRIRNLSFLDRGIELDLGDIMYVVARRRP